MSGVEKARPGAGAGYEIDQATTGSVLETIVLPPCNNADLVLDHGETDRGRVVDAGGVS